MNKVPWRIVWFVVMSGLSLRMQAAAPPVSAETDGQKDKTATTNDDSAAKGSSVKASLTVRGGYTRYAMTGFNHTQQSQGNNTISGGPTAGVEAFPLDFKIPDKVPMLGGNRIDLPLVGVEYLDAGANTTHAAGGNSATVEWDLRLIGFYLAPEILLKNPTWLRIRPIEVGYYPLGSIFNANLAITDRPGRLELTSKAVGFKTEILIGTGFNDNKGWLFGSIGYRWLRFTDVSQKPTGGFLTSVRGPAATSGNLQSSLDFSGVFAMVGVTWL